MAVTAQVSFTDQFWPSVYNLSAAETKQVVKAVTQLSHDPTADSLRLHPVQGDASGRKYTCRANQDIRILLLKQGDLLVLERAGHHDDMYELAARIDLIYNQGTGRVVVAERATAEVAPTETRRCRPVASDEPGLFEHWGHVDLQEAGLGHDEIAAVRACTTEEQLLDLPFDEETLCLLIDLLRQTPEQWRQPGLDAEAALTEDIRQAITDRGALAGLSPLFGPDEIDKLLSGPIEEWMVFLHPDQRAAAERRYEGPARVRGSAGTGKTVVALHRAVALVRRFERDESNSQPVLFTTFIKSLPPVFERLYHRLPLAKPGDAIEFCHLDRLAHRICVEAGDRPTIDPRRVDATFAAALKRTGARLTLGREYLREEITYVIKGRGMTTLDAYLAVERTGRRTPLNAAMREQVWALKTAWDEGLAEVGAMDFPDIVLRARDHARSRAEPTYRAAIIDEAQDLTLVGLQLVRALVNGGAGVDRPDGLLVVGDGAQRVYPGGFTLRQAGVEVRGRTTLLRTNYRNSAEIIAAAMAVAGSDAVDDLGDTYARADAAAAASRAGQRPVLVLCAGPADEIRVIIEHIHRLTTGDGVSRGDLAVSASTNAQVEEISKQLALAEVPTIKLADYDGTPVDKVKVGTHFRIKGLEFKVVFLPRLGAADFPRRLAPGQTPEEHADQRALSVSQLFVAMTRARDQLWLLASGEPSEVLVGAVDSFDVVNS